MSDEIYESAAALWPTLIERAGLTGRHGSHAGAYDAALVDDVREALFPGATAPMEDLLATGDLSAGALVRALLGAIRPFALMKIDILKLLEAAGARGGGDSLRIRFAFDPDNPLDLLLDQFREQMEAVEEVVGEAEEAEGAAAPTPTKLGDLKHGARYALPRAGVRDRDAALPSVPPPPPLRAWLDAGRLAPMPVDWRTGRADLDRVLATVVALTDDVVVAIARNARRWDGVTRESELQARVGSVGLTLFELLGLNAEAWPEAVVRLLVRAHAHVAAGDEAGVAAIVDDLDALLPTPVGRARALFKRLEDVLNLPVWQRRHEVYAVWLGAQMHQALADRWDFHFHLVDGALRFPFGGAHLATLTRRRDDEVLFWWTELRTLHDDLPSGKRLEGIQPDYRLRRAPLDGERADVAVVEAKQHRGYSTKEFKDALADYAHACPAAGVLLANYGPVAGSVLKDTPDRYRPRCAAFARLHPGKSETVAEFRKALFDVVERVLDGRPVALDARRFKLEPGGKPVPVRTGKGLEPIRPTSTAVTLTWGAEPKDLDLFVRRLGDEEEREVGFRYPCSEDAWLRADVTDGFGPEVIEIARGHYEVTVRRFPEGSLAGSGAAVEVAFPGGGEPLRLTLPEGHDDNAWNVGIIDVGARTFVAAKG